MRGKIICLMIWAALAATTRADEKIPVLQAGSEAYSNVTVTSVSATDVFFTFDGGMANVKLKNLLPDWQKHFRFDPSKARALELKQAENTSKYHEQFLRQPVVHPPDMNRESAADAGAAERPWRNDLAGALKQARAENKLVLLDFTGSDWWPWCIKFDQEVLSTDRFTGYASSRLELVKLDFPHHTPQPNDIRQANAALAGQFGVHSDPTYVLLNADGRELGRQVGYCPRGPDAFISKLDRFAGR